MSGVLIDSNVLLDLMTEDEHRFSWSAEAIERAADTSRLVIDDNETPPDRSGGVASSQYDRSNGRTS